MDNGKIFSEVYSVLLALGDDFINRLPKDILNIIEKTCDKNAIVELEINDLFEEYKISKPALNILAKLHYDYWCNSKEEKQKLYNLLIKNEKIVSKQLAENMFKRKK